MWPPGPGVIVVESPWGQVEGKIDLKGSEVVAPLELLQTSLWEGDGRKDPLGSPQGEVRGASEKVHPEISGSTS